MKRRQEEKETIRREAEEKERQRQLALKRAEEERQAKLQREEEEKKRREDEARAREAERIRLETHKINYDSEIDSIEITHTAHNRNGFGLGAVVAAEWIVGKKGIFTMRDVLNIK